MRVDPASIDQIRQGRDGRVHVIDADVGGVAEDLKRIHPGLGVRYHEASDHYSVFFESEDGTETYLITTALQLDHRIVDRIREIDRDGRSGYDYAKELEEGTLKARERALAAFRDRVGEHAEQAAYAIRRDMGERYKGRAFIPRAV
jgi:hypothetical protein